MRPINLIPEEERGLHGGVARTGAVVYVLLGALAILLLGVVMLVQTSNTVSEREKEVAHLETQRATVTAQASRLAAYVNFEEVAQHWEGQVTDLANGRFDWVRVVHQLALILPPGISITHLTGSAGGSGEAGGLLSVQTPSLALAGCSSGQDETAAVVASMKQIDGVTRVGLANSEQAREQGGESGCSKGQFEFELLAAFDEAPLSPDAGEGTPIISSEASTSEVPAEGETDGAGEGEGKTENEGTSETAASPSPTPEGTG